MEYYSTASPVFTCAEIRDFDRRAIEELEIPGVLLMENAGRVLTETLIDSFRPKRRLSRILILAGPGNNGGDGFVMARQLQRLSFKVDVLAIGKPHSWKGDAEINLRILKNLTDENLCLGFFDKEDIDDSLQYFRSSLSRADIIVDAILGTGAHGNPRFPINEIIREVNSAHKSVFAVDIPSGLNGDTGLASEQTIQARVTCTLAAFKKGFASAGSAVYTGRVILGDIGVESSKLSAR